MGVIYKLLELPEKDKKMFLKRIIYQEAIERLKSQKTNELKIKVNK